MSDITIASRYAKSLLDMAKDQNVVEEIYADMQLFHSTLKKNSQLRAVLSNPIVSPVAKDKILEQIFAEKVLPLTASFFKIMIRKHREGFLYLTAKQFFVLYNELKGIITAKVVSAAALSEKSKNELINIVSGVVKADVRLDASVDPSLIGGFVLTVGDKQVDTSLLRNLKELKKKFMGNANLAR